MPGGPQPVVSKLAAWGALVASLCMVLPVSGQNHPELEWQVLETEHFRIVYHDGLDQMARRAAAIAEEAHVPLTSLYGYEPDGPVRIVLKDYDDYANGAAFFYHDTIEIWTTALEHDFDLRGTSDWLRNVITHEYTHIISLGAARKTSQRMPAAFVEYYGYKEEKNRQDVLTGAPDRVVAYPLANTIIPMWFAEGVAQHMADGIHYDRWDSHRDMILRTAVLNGELLGYDEMGVFGKRGFGNEFVYDHGYGLVTHIAQQYGDEVVAEICRGVGQWPSLNVNRAIERATGTPAREVWSNWRDAMRQRYETQVAFLGELRRGETVIDVGFSSTRPAYSPDGESLAYLSTLKADSGPHALVIRDLATGDDETIAGGVVSTPSWSPDGHRLLFVRKDRADRYGSRRADIHEYDSEADGRGLVSKLLWSAPRLVGAYSPDPPEVRQLSKGLRALYPAASPDGSMIAFVQTKGSGCGLGVMMADGTDVRYLLELEDGSQMYTPQWSPDGRDLVFSFSRFGQRDIARMRVADQTPAHRQVRSGSADAPGLEVLIASEGTDRDPVYSADGGQVIFSSDASGIFNLYSLSLTSGEVEQVTNLVGGAFYPSASPAGEVAFAAYDSGGYEIRVISLDEAQPTAPDRFAPEGRSLVARSPAGLHVGPADPTGSPALGPSIAGAKVASGEAAPALEPKPYGIDFLRTSLMPRLMLDEGFVKAGVYFSSSDVLEQQSVYGGATLAPSNRDRDLYTVFKYRGWRPTVTLSFIHMKRHSTRGDSSDARDFIVTGMNFSLNRLSIGVGGKLNRRTSLEAGLTYDRYDASLESDVFVPRRDGLPGFDRRAQKAFGYTYLNGFDLDLTYRHDSVPRRRDRDINPRKGRRIYLRYDRMHNYFIKGFDEQNSSFLQEEYLTLPYNQLTVDWREYLGLPLNATLGLRAYGGWIGSEKVDDERVNDFFDFHLGGITFMKGYTYYSIAGRKAAMGTATLRFPILSDIRRTFLHLYVDKVYGAVYADVGKAWDGRMDEAWPRHTDDADVVEGRTGPLWDAGGQLRFDLFSFYSMPTRVQMDLAYGLDEVRDVGPWKFYLTVLFNYINWIDPGE